ncbi:FAD-binding oxidoreductase [Martelella sp. AD-3]|uniref:NAD(P)/FAD-dependent oxidoreductase n=1 Tax=Martelella sp. AD-3 TaxID=686597 RepID=UPI00055A8DD5|nr:FAD-binding oxidoreductase [Martelella sp. AD-3]AMM86885.1 oxidoreductase [Martelella sp. AD-3]MAM10228.1 FAD-binding oxidoreductase [Rhizobiaceae bacterium]
MVWQSPIAPGISWYQATLPERPTYPALDGSTTADVAVIGGGFTGLQAACQLAEDGVDVVLIDAARFGDGASGRNGGQLGTGQHWWPEELETKLGAERSQAFFRIAEEAKSHLLDFARKHKVNIDFKPGQLSVAHKRGMEYTYRRHVETLAERYDYPHLSFMSKAETAERLGSDRFFCGIRDIGTGHIHPLKLLVGIAGAAAAAGARLHEMTKAENIDHVDGKNVIETARGSITAERVLIACNGYIEDHLEPKTASKIMPIRSFIAATTPVKKDRKILPGGESVDDSRFVVRYFRKAPTGEMLFGGREVYSADNPKNISRHLRRQIAEIYPQLKDVEITHAWGGSVGITMPRRPLVHDIMPGVTSIGGFSGHGVMLSNYCGKLYADEIAGRSLDLELYRDLDIPSFPGGGPLRKPLLFLALTWFALRDRF